MQQERDILLYQRHPSPGRVSGHYSNSTQYLCTCSSKDCIYHSVHVTSMLASRNNWRGTLPADASAMNPTHEISAEKFRVRSLKMHSVHNSRVILYTKMKVIHSLCSPLLHRSSEMMRCNSTNSKAALKFPHDFYNTLKSEERRKVYSQIGDCLRLSALI